MQDVEPRPHLVYILSPSYSGSTLATLMLAQHPKVATIGELKATSLGPLDNYQCSCGEPIQACTFWSQLEKAVRADDRPFELASLGTHFSSTSASLRKVLLAQVRSGAFEAARRLLLRVVPSWRRAFEETIKQNQAVVAHTLALQNGDCFLDGSKDPQRLSYLIESDLFDISIVQMTRDGRAQAHSQRLKSDFTGTYQEAVREWRSTMQQIERTISRHCDVRSLRIRYEDLCADPNSVMQSVMDFIGLSAIDVDWRSVDIKNATTHMLGNAMRTRSQIKLSLDQRWMNDLSTEELNDFERLAGEVNRMYGYDQQLPSCEPA